MVRHNILEPEYLTDQHLCAGYTEAEDGKEISELESKEIEKVQKKQNQVK